MAGTARIKADCGDGISVVAVRNLDNTAVAAMVTPATDSGTAPLHIVVQYMPCASEAITLTVDYVGASVAEDGSAVVNTLTVSGTKGHGNLFVADGDTEPYVLGEAQVAYAALIVLACS